MDKSWMRAPRSTTVYADGVKTFLEFAFAKTGMSRRVLCPCKLCANRYWIRNSLVTEHLICEGFMPGYNTWVFHGEDFVNPEAGNNSQPQADASPANDPEDYADSDQMDEMLLEGFGMYDIGSVGFDEGADSDDEDNEDVGSDTGVDAEAYRKLVEDGSKELYPGCTTFSKLQFLVRLMNIKSTFKVVDKCYDEILSLFKEALPEGHTIAQVKNFHASKRYIKDVGIGYESIDACKNDCIMFRGSNSDAKECPICKTSRWKSEKVGVDGKRVYKVPQKVIRHFKLKPRARRLFMCSETSPHMSWHSNGRTKDRLTRQSTEANKAAAASGSKVRGKQGKDNTQDMDEVLAAESKSIRTRERRRSVSQADHTQVNEPTLDSIMGIEAKERKRKINEESQTTASKRQKQKQKAEDYECVLATSELDKPKPKTSYRQLLADCIEMTKVKEEKCDEIITNSKQNDEHEEVLNKSWLRPRQPMKGNRIKTGMEVGLTSPNSLQLIAMGTVQDIENEEFIEVLVNIVFKRSTVLPRAKGRMTTVGEAEARCVHWPKKNVTEAELETINSGIVKHVVEKELTRQSEQTEVDPKRGDVKEVKKRRTANSQGSKTVKLSEL